MLMGGIAGSAMASASAMGSILGPEMEKEGYSKEFGVAVNITSATTGLVIPPSNVLIVYSLASGGVSITALFLAGYVPGILTGIAIIIMAVSLLVYKSSGIAGVTKLVFKMILAAVALFAVGLLIKYGLDNYSKTTNYGIYAALLTGFVIFLAIRSRKKNSRVRSGFVKFMDALPSLLMLVIVIGGIIAGFFTATEASAIAVLYSVILAFVYREVNVKHLPEILLKSVKTTSIVMLLIATSMALSWIMSYENIPQTVSAGLINISDNPFVILLIINLILLAVGVFMDMTPAVLIFTPIFLPV